MKENRRLKQVKSRLKELEKKREPWLKNFEIIAKYMLARKQNFRSEATPGEFLSTEVLTAAPSLALQVSVSTMLSALFPSATKSVRIKAASILSQEFRDSKEVQEFFEKQTSRLNAKMADPHLRLINILDENQNDLLAFGTGAIGVFRVYNDPKNYIRVESVDIKTMLIDEDASSNVTTVYIRKEYTIFQLMDLYPKEKYSAKVQEYIEKGEYDKKVTLLRVLEKRPLEDRKGKEGQLSMPFRMEVYEMTSTATGSTVTNVTVSDTDILLEEAGFERFPILVSRFWKGRDEVYGRGPGSVAIPTILELNRLVEYFADGCGKKARPPLIANGDALGSDGIIDVTIGGVTRTHSGARLQDGPSRPALEPVYVVGELNSLKERIKELEDEMTRIFFIDRLLDFNNSTRMTYGETQIRENLRGMSLNSVFARQISELFVPLVELFYDIMFSVGELGLRADDPRVKQMTDLGLEPLVIPEKLVPIMAAGYDFYEIEFVTPAMRLQRQEEINGIKNFLELLAAVMSMNPEAGDTTNLDRLLEEMSQLEGVPPEIIRSIEEVMNMRKERKAAQEAAMQAEQQRVQAEAARAGAQGAQAAAIAAKNAKEAGIDIGAFTNGQG